MEHLFYHGTSSLFLRSIKKNGLGGINPNIDYKLLELLRFLYELSESKLQDNNDYLIVRKMYIPDQSVPLIPDQTVPVFRTKQNHYF